MCPSRVRPGDRGDRRVALERLPYVAGDWERIVAAHPHAEVFHSPEWLAYLSAAQHAEPVVALVRLDGAPVGHFVGAVVRLWGMRILGSPMPGWMTQHMGFLLQNDPDGQDDPDGQGVPDPLLLVEGLRRFAFGELGCIHVELSQRGVAEHHLSGSGYTVKAGATYRVDLTAAEDVILDRMATRTRRYVRRSSQRGLTVEVATDLGFADDYHAQLTEVFARQGLAPTYGVERVRHLIRLLGPSGQLLLLRVRGADGECLATGISVGRNGIAVNWGAASHRATAALHPNELLWWEAMRIWRSRGVTCYDMGGRGDYKAKYGGVLTNTSHFHRSRFALLTQGRAVAERLVRARQVAAGRRMGPVA